MIRFVLTYLFFVIQVFASPEQELKDAYLSFLHSSQSKYARVIDYSFSNDQKSFEGKLRWSQKGDNNFSLSFILFFPILNMLPKNLQT